MIGQTIQLNEHATLDIYQVTPQSPTERLPLILILPGGGYLFISPRESAPVALRVNTHYVHAAVLHYTTVIQRPITLPELMEEVRLAIDWIHGQAQSLQVDTTRISLMGFSAGGHLAAHCSSQLAHLLDKTILAYPATRFPRMTPEQQADTFHRLFGRIFNENMNEDLIRETVFGLLANDPTRSVNRHTRPTFVFQTTEDVTVDPRATVQYVLLLLRHHVPCEMVLYQKGPHGLSLADETCNPAVFPHQARWFDQAMEWLKDQDGSQSLR